MSEAKSNKNRRLIMWLAGLAVFMFAFCFMLVPLYNLICNHLGINGRSKNESVEIPAGMVVDMQRTIRVDFATALNGKLNFVFKPLNYHLYIHPGETKLTYFYAENVTGNGITVQAIPSITPDVAAKYLKKTQCFCFTQQYFFAGEKADMPVYFYIDPAIPKDIKEVTLSYTLFDASKYLKKDQQEFREGRIEL